MIIGHTKFSPDACFGFIKRKFHRTDVSSLDDLARVVNESAACFLFQSGAHTFAGNSGLYCSVPKKENAAKFRYL